MKKKNKTIKQNLMYKSVFVCFFLNKFWLCVYLCVFFLLNFFLTKWILFVVRKYWLPFKIKNCLNDLPTTEFPPFDGEKFNVLLPWVWRRCSTSIGFDASFADDDRFRVIGPNSSRFRFVDIALYIKRKSKKLIKHWTKIENVENRWMKSCQRLNTYLIIVVCIFCAISGSSVSI